MHEQSERNRPGRRWLVAVVAVGAAAAPCRWLWGFTVDDALIPCRIADNLARGFGYRFNADGPVVDAVTPLGWAHLLSVVGGSGPLRVLLAAKWVGFVAWLLAAGLIGWWAASMGERRRRLLPLTLLATCTPLAAWAVAGLETGVVSALGTLALARAKWAPLAAGLAAAWRPELIPWAAALSVGVAIARERAVVPRVVPALIVAVLPAFVVAVIRYVWFGSAAPLAVLAKPPDLGLGALYAAGTLLLTGPPLLLLAPKALCRIDGHHRAIAIASLAHFPAVALAGGDWMPLSRLVVPVLPGLILVGVAVGDRAAGWATSLRLILALGAAGVLAVGAGADAAKVGARRRALVDAARPVLVGARAVAAVDVGWLGAATPARIVDLAGATDPSVAVLPGSHTTKRLPKHFLGARGVDAVVVLCRTTTPCEPDREADATLLRWASGRGFVIVARLPLGGTSKRYIIFRSKNDL